MVSFDVYASAPPPVECSWCGTRYAKHQRNCTNCGGPLPGPTPPDPGPEPPPAPREIPGAYLRRLYVSRNVLVIVGASLGMPGLALAAVPLVLGWSEFMLLTVLLTGGLFAIIGLPLFAVGWRRARRQHHALRDGTAVQGRILELYQDGSESINGRHPWAMVYGYEAGGRSHIATVKSWAWADAVRQLYAVGSPVHVLVVPEAPQRSALYPPIR